MTLIEVLVALAISGLAVGGIVSGYIYSFSSSDRWGLSLAAHSHALARIEDTRSAKWDTSSWPSTDQLVSSNFPPQTVVLDLSGTGARATYATNYTQISQLSTTPPLKMVRVDCVWRFKGALETNSIVTCRSPDQ
jgi:prepilin-type N-terminal cleavage/methylation domain-containing protein